MPNHRAFSTTVEPDICREYASGKTLSEIAQGYSCSRETIARCLRSNGVTVRSKGQGRRRYTCNHYFFDVIDSELKAYWLGFLAADGSIINGTIRLNLQYGDRQHIRLLLRDLGSDYPIRTRIQNGFRGSCLAISSQPMLVALARFGVIPRKKRTLPWPDLPEHILRSYFRGFFDANGSWGAKNTSKPMVQGPSFMLVGNKQFIQQCQKWLMERCSLRETKFKIQGRDRTSYTMTYRGNNQARRIASLLYDGATRFLARKHAVITTFLASSFCTK